MSLKRDMIRNKLSSIFTSISSILIPIFQYVPCTAIWFGIMSVPLITYLGYFFRYPHILISDISFLFSSYEIYIILIGVALFLTSLIYQIFFRKQLIQSGPYKYVRHPQYLALIFMTFGMTLIIFRTSPIINYNLNIDAFSLIFLIWIVEVVAYIILAKIEEYALKTKYGDEYIEYVNNVSFMIPFLKFNRNGNRKE
ncbi:MAG: methyltransferase family protein [Promethearchaeota archaeon]